MYAKIQPVQVFPNNANVLVLSTPVVTLGSSAVMTAFLKDTFEGVYLTPGATLALTGVNLASGDTIDYGHASISGVVTVNSSTSVSIAVTAAGGVPAGNYNLTYDDNVTVLEGTPAAGRTVVIQFESEAACMSWWNSPEYRELANHRHAGTTTHSISIVHAIKR
jgi:uncharacterized protein (DUF1330 family)